MHTSPDFATSNTSQAEPAAPTEPAALPATQYATQAKQPTPTPRAVLTALTAGVIGGAIANQLHLPLAWMLGAFLANLLIIAAGANPAFPGVIRRLILSIIGVYLGASFTPQTFANAGGILLSLLWMLLYIITIIIAARHAFLRLLPVNRRTAFCCALPGAYSLTIALAEEKGDVFTVTVIQTMRIVMIIMTIPFLARFLSPEGIAGAAPLPTAADNAALATTATNIAGTAWLAALALPAAIAGLLFKLRAPVILAIALILSGAAHITGTVNATLPQAPIDIALMLLGTAIGCSFLIFRGAPLLRTLKIGFAINGFMIITAALFAVVGAPLLNVSFWALLLALAPGGIAEISLIAIALNIDPTYVTLHQILRIVGLILFLPPLVAYLERRERRLASQNQQP